VPTEHGAIARTLGISAGLLGSATNLSDDVFATCRSDIACFNGQRRTILTSLRYRWSPARLSFGFV
jgi:hypothetical protein